MTTMALAHARGLRPPGVTVVAGANAAGAPRRGRNVGPVTQQTSYGFHCLVRISSGQLFDVFLSLASTHPPLFQYIYSPHSPAASLGCAETMPVAAVTAASASIASNCSL